MKMVATRIVHSGLVARIGDAIVIGKCFSAKKAHVQDAPTKADFANNNACWFVDSGSTNRKSLPTKSGRKYDQMTKGNQMVAPHMQLQSNTGATALSRTDAFFSTP